MSVESKIKELIQSNDVVLFMKGSRHFPQCGFSGAVTKMLNEFLPKYETVNVLADPEMREGIKKFSNWPTIPQLYIKGEFIGGSDIVRELYESGELAQKLGVPVAASKVPQLKITDAAIENLKKARDDESLGLRVEISEDWATDLFLDDKKPTDVVIDVKGFPVFLDAASARKADGLSIDFVLGKESGFKIENPNAPPRVRPMRVQELKAMMDKGEKLALFDVRTPEERAIAVIDAAHHLDEKGAEYFESLPKDTPVIFLCHHGHRSRRAAERALEYGYTRVYNLEGGIDAWSREIDPKVPTY